MQTWAPTNPQFRYAPPPGKPMKNNRAPSPPPQQDSSQSPSLPQRQQPPSSQATKPNSAAATSTTKSSEKATTANVISAPTLTSRPNPIVGKKPARLNSLDVTKPATVRKNKYSYEEETIDEVINNGAQGPYCRLCDLEWPSNIVFCGECGAPLR
jgi:hypothetical protein